jgi:hypothetical protein
MFGNSGPTILLLSRITGAIRHGIRTAMRAQWSSFTSGRSGAADREFSWANATPTKIADPVIHSLIDKVRVGPPPTENAERYRQGATVTIALRDGRSFTSTVYAPKGSGQLGIAWNDIDAKFRTLAPLGGLGGDAISRTLDIIHDFRRVASVSPLLDLLRPAN